MSASSKKKARKLSEASAQSQNSKKKMSKQAKETILVICVAVVLLAALAIGLSIYSSQQNKPDYDVSIAAGTVGTEEVSVPMMNYFYMDAISNFYNSYGSFVSYFLDSSTPLNQQAYSSFSSADSESYDTWDDYFIAAAKDSAGDTYALYTKALEAGYALDSEDEAEIDSNLEELETSAVVAGFVDADAYLTTLYGPGCDLENFETYLRVQTLAGKYYDGEVAKITVSDEEAAAAYAEDPSAYDRIDFSVFTAQAAVSYDDDGNPVDPTAEEIAAAQQEAVEMSTNFDETKATTQKALTKSTIASAYSEDVANWLFAESRKAGDVDMFEGSVEGSTYVVRFDARDDLNYNTANIQLLKINIDSGELEEGEKTAQERFNEIWAEFEADPTEEKLASLIAEYSEDPSVSTDNGVKENVNKQTYASVSELTSWLFNATQEPGAYQKFENDSYGYYIVRFKDYGGNYRSTSVNSALTSEKQSEWYEGIAHSVEFVVNEEQIAHMRTGIILDNFFSSSAQ